MGNETSSDSGSGGHSGGSSSSSGSSSGSKGQQSNSNSSGSSSTKSPNSGSEKHETKLKCPDGYRSEKVVEASHVERPNTNRFKIMRGVYNHHGIKMKTESGKEWLIHDDGKKGLVITEEKYMDKKTWSEKKKLDVKNPDIKVQNVMNVMSTSMHPDYAGPTNYWTTGTCILSTGRAERLLEKEAPPTREEIDMQMNQLALQVPFLPLL